MNTRRKSLVASEGVIPGLQQHPQPSEVQPSGRARKSKRASAELPSPPVAAVAAPTARRGARPPPPHSNQPPGSAAAPTTRARKHTKSAAQPAAVAPSVESGGEDDTDNQKPTVLPSCAANDSHHVELSDAENDENMVFANIVIQGTGKRPLSSHDSCAAPAPAQPEAGDTKRMRPTSFIRTPLSPRSDSHTVAWPQSHTQAAQHCVTDPGALAPSAAAAPPPLQQRPTSACALDAAFAAVAAVTVAVSPGAAPHGITQPAVAAATAATAAATAAVAAVAVPVFNPSSEEQVMMAKSALSVSQSQDCGHFDSASGAPVGRQQQFDQLLALLEQSGQHQSSHTSAPIASTPGAAAAAAGSSGCQTVYASGLPGTGKSLTVTALLRSLRSQPAAPATVWVSCNAFKETSEVFAVLLRECTLELIGRHVEPPSDPATCHSALVKVLQQSGGSGSTSSSANGGRGSPSHTPRPVIIVLDEIDRLISRDAQDLYQLFTLPALAGPNVSLLAIANSLDLTDRLLPKLRCQGIAPQLVCFPAYSRSQVEAILSSRLQTLPWPVVDPQALEACARNVSQNIGDLRHALKTCSLALDVLLDGNAAATKAAAAASASPTLRSTVSLQDMRTALARCAGGRGGALNAASSTQATILALPTQQQLALLALATAVGITAASASASRASGPAASAASPAGPSRFVPRVLASPTFSAPSAFQVLSPSTSVRSQQAAGHPHPDSPTHSVKTTTQQQQQCARARAGISPVPFRGGGRGLPPSPRVSHSPGLAAAGGILAGDAGHAVTVEAVYSHYAGFCAKLAMARMEMSEFGCDVCGRLETDGLLRKGGARGGGRGKGGGGGRRNSGCGAGTGLLTLLVAVRDVQAALRGNVVFRNIVGVPV
ncbi:MAG: hypothetical protein WDW38_001937 [Sanguina aurantia]